MDLLSNNLDKLVAIALMLSASIYLRILLQIAGQSWVKTTAHTATLALLPILTYVITSVISGNIALSLGMVGALSIVRFRNPVRSPLELSVYFGAITIGIAASVSLNWLVLLVLAVTLVACVLALLNLASNMLLNKTFFTASFSEGNNLSSLVITTNIETPLLNDNKYLMGKTETKDEVTYTFAHNNFKTLQEIEKKAKSIADIKSIHLNR